MDMRPLQRVKEHSSLEVGEVPKSLRLLVTTALDGANWMICNQDEIVIVQSWMVIRFMWLADIKKGKRLTELSSLSSPLGKSSTLFSRYTEIWSEIEGSKSIKLADPKLEEYIWYPELVLVDTNFCVNPWIKNVFWNISYILLNGKPT